MNEDCFACFSGMCQDHEGGMDEPEPKPGCIRGCIIERRLYADMATEHVHHAATCPNLERGT